jgi:DNA-binding transcriptional LysR family regulator
MSIPDLRALQVFNEIGKTRSVSQAAANLDMGQPAVSVTLAKLREQFRDPLFVRVGNRMEPTPFALSLDGMVAAALAAVEQVYGHQLRFDPATAVRTFRICMADISQLVLLPKLWPYLRDVAPGIQIDIVPITPELGRQLERGETDLAFGFFPQLEAGFFQQALFDQEYICLLAYAHPRIREQLSLAQYEAEVHAAVDTAGTGHWVLDEAIERRQIRRQVALRVPNYMAIPFVIEQTDMLVTLPDRLAGVLKGKGHFRSLPLPFPAPRFTVKQHWHERFHHDPGNQWLRRTIAELVAAPAG